MTPRARWIVHPHLIICFGAGREGRGGPNFLKAQVRMLLRGASSTPNSSTSFSAHHAPRLCGCQWEKGQIKPILAQAWGYPVLGTQCHPAQDHAASARLGRGWLMSPRLPDAVGFAGVLACRGTHSLAAPSHQHASGCCSRGARPPLGATCTLAPTSLLRLDLLLRLLQDAFDGVVGAGLRRPDPRRDAT